MLLLGGLYEGAVLKEPLLPDEFDELDEFVEFVELDEPADEELEELDEFVEPDALTVWLVMPQTLMNTVAVAATSATRNAVLAPECRSRAAIVTREPLPPAEASVTSPTGCATQPRT